MDIYPAIDLMDGKVVRLRQGKKHRKKIYGDALTYARKFEPYVDTIHIVDLDGAFTGTPKNLEIVKTILEHTSVKVQYGGGLRNYEAVEKAYTIGIENAIIGTKAFDFSFLKRITKDFQGITVSLDVKNGTVFLDGWEEKTSINVKTAYDKLNQYVNRFIVTAIAKDGTLEGATKIEKFWKNDEFIYAGGVTSVNDVLRLRNHQFSGIVIGKAIYEGQIDLKEVMQVIGG